ncbi:thioredoxin family protein [Alkalibacter mobilis]|uniref:thioredoxin family protein n=1 Tax=Alkalibacter mobilis TaxID=2787712 RepID=UPI00189E165B|nr:thioredoxin family protein [Alkalibacter mobilis]MBF7095533.1 TM0996/MTH895 family glutaredoxin-like protein [Alkalibacter mobilis]
MEIKILGTGCAKCNKLEEQAKDAVKELGLQVDVEKVTDLKDIASYGVMNTPALVVDGKVVVSGKVIKSKEIVKYLQK